MIETVAESRIRKSTRPTIMSGRVVTLALDFKQEDGVFGPRDTATGPFEVSISRDAVMVHRADCEDVESVDLLIEALRFAKVEFDHLRRYRSGWVD